MNPILPIAAAGLGLILLTKKSNAAPKAAPTQNAGALQKPTARPTAELSESLKTEMATALGKLGVHPFTGKLDGTANAEAIQYGSQVVGRLESEGFFDAARDLRKYVDEAAKSVPTPASAKPIAAAAPSILTPAQREYIARVIALERDPNKLGLFIDWLKKLAPSQERDNMIQMAQALALQLAAAQATASTLEKIDAIIKSPTPEAVAAAASTAPAAMPKLPAIPLDGAGSPEVTVVTPKATVPAAALPETPLVVPKLPVPQAVPNAITPEELAAKAMVSNLQAVQKKYGVKSAKGKEDKTLVKKFQSLTGLVADGSSGPATLLMAAAKGATDLPLVYYWPKAATAKTVGEYRNGLSRVADMHEQKGRPEEANQIRMAAGRELGQSGINGPAFGAATQTTSAPKPAAPKPAAASSSGSVATLPAGTAVSATAAKNAAEKAARELAAYLIALQSQYGGKSAKGKQNLAMVKAWQKLMGITADGQPGMATNIAMAKLGVSVLPLVLYWPAANTAAKIAEYRKALGVLAALAEEKKDFQTASFFAGSLERERGQYA